MKKFSHYFFIVVLVCFCVYSSFAQNERKTITLDDIFKNRKFASRGAGNMHSMRDGVSYCQWKNDSLNVYDYRSGNYLGTIVVANRLIPEEDSVPIDKGSFEFSEDERRILFNTEQEPIYRYSSKSYYYIFDTASKKLISLSDRGKQRLATFSPDGSKIAFVRENNLFIRDISDMGLLKPGAEIQITFDGKMNEIIYGAADWVYEEEFAFTRAFQWSPDNKALAFYRFDESKVKEYHLTYYGDLYPELCRYKYPKAGEDNSVISLFLFRLDTKAMIPVDIGPESDIYIPRIKWTNDPDLLAFYRLNRHQNKLELLLASVMDGKTKVIYTEENKYYIDINDHWTFLKNSREFILTSEKDGFNHIYLYNMDGTLVKQLTSGEWDVTDVPGVDESRGRVYYLSPERSPLERSLYYVTLDGKTKKCLTTREGTNVPSFSADFSFFINRWSDIVTPPYYAVYDYDGNEVRMLQDNAKLKETLKEYGFGKAEFFTFTTKDHLKLNGWMLKPFDFDPSKQYPVLFTIYGGPGSQTVTDSWGTVSSWNQFFAQNGIIVVSVDNRGTGARGEEFKKCTYLQLGKHETEDQIEAAQYLGSKSYVDKSRIGIWGWSFGGYLTLSCLTRGADYFSVGVAVASVTNWKYYDNIYTERFMRTPEENSEGYESNSPITHAGELKGKLLLVHGMADDNVHPQNSYDMITALVSNDKKFEIMLYPNSNHGIYTGNNTSFHLYQRISDFILGNLKK
jgi:dipeptidyl-peptidase-4